MSAPSLRRDRALVQLRVKRLRKGIRHVELLHAHVIMYSHGKKNLEKYISIATCLIVGHLRYRSKIRSRTYLLKNGV